MTTMATRGQGQSEPAATTDRPEGLSALPSALPEVERRATIPQGFRAGGAVAGIKASGRPDLAIVATLPGAAPASAAAVFTPNAFAAAPVRLSREHLKETSGGRSGAFGLAEAVVSTSGSANAATGAAGDADQAEVAGFLAGALGIARERTLLLSTGVIGTRLPLDKVAAGIDALAPRLAASDDALAAAAEALRTTDTRTKARDRDDHAARSRRPRGPPRPGHRHRQGRRDDPPPDGDNARGRPH